MNKMNNNRISLVSTTNIHCNYYAYVFQQKSRAIRLPRYVSRLHVSIVRSYFVYYFWHWNSRSLQKLQKTHDIGMMVYSAIVKFISICAVYRIYTVFLCFWASSEITGRFKMILKAISNGTNFFLPAVSFVGLTPKFQSICKPTFQKFSFFSVVESP